ncbi:MAG: SgcJ/EcaC family oxidoreductase [Acidobacteria bacterium]|nr:SgcJ/EcaC family oxidoreductase [Acidobacteriota bacterium]
MLNAPASSSATCRRTAPRCQRYKGILGSIAATLALSISPVLAAVPRPLAVTVDDLPLAGGSLHSDPEEREKITRDLLDVLARHRIQAVGLVIWGNVRTETDRRILKMWLDAGHELGNHSASHPSYTTTTSEDYIADMEAGRAGLAEFLAPRGATVRYFRFPMLREGETEAKLTAMRTYLQASSQRNLHVTIDDQDWSFERPWVEARRQGDTAAMERIGLEYLESLHLSVRHHEQTGDQLAGRVTPQILLLHANEVGAARWDELFTWLADTGHRFVPAHEILADPIFASPPAYVGTHGPGYWDRLLAVRRGNEARAAARDLLREQAAAWNRGDLEAFCSVYADDATFVSPSGLTRGRDQVLERYRKRYPDQAAMGHLSLDVLEIRPAEGTEVSMLGDARPSRVHGLTITARWTLAYTDRDAATGLTLLVLRPGPQGWRIVQDASM